MMSKASKCHGLTRSLDSNKLESSASKNLDTAEITGSRQEAVMPANNNPESSPTALPNGHAVNQNGSVKPNHVKARKKLSLPVGDSAVSEALPPPKSSWLLRLFESKLFEMSIAIAYLFKSKEPGVLTYLGNKLFVSIVYMTLIQDYLKIDFPKLLNLFLM